MVVLGLIMEGILVLVACVLMAMSVAGDRVHDRIWHELEMEQTVAEVPSQTTDTALDTAA